MSRLLLGILFAVGIILVMYGSYMLYSFLNLKKEYRYKHQIHLLFFILDITLGTIFYLVIRLMEISHKTLANKLSNLFPPSILLAIILIIYLLFKVIYKKYFDNYLKNNNPSLEDKLPIQYYEKNNKIYIYPKYLTFAKIFNTTALSIMILVSIGISLLYTIKEYHIKNILILIEIFLLLTIFLLEISIYLDGNTEEALSSKKENNNHPTKKKIRFANLNQEYHRLWSKQLLGSYQVENDYDCQIIENNPEADADSLAKPSFMSANHTVSNFIYSRVFYPIINGEDIIIENCLLENFSEIIVPIVNMMFATNKKMLFLCDSKAMVKSCEKWLEELDLKGDVSNSNMVIDVLDYQPNHSMKTDSRVDIYLGTVDLVLNSQMIHQHIDVVFGLNIDKIIATSALQLNLLSSMLSNDPHQSTQYILFANRVNGLKQVISQVFMRNDFKYQVIEKSYENNLITNFFGTEKGSFQQEILPNFVNQNLGQLLPLAIPGVKYGFTNVDILSVTSPFSDQKLSLQTAQSLLKPYLEKDIINLDETIRFFSNENFLKVKDENVLIVEDNNYNPALIVLNWLKYSKSTTLLNIVSKPYLLRDYIITNIDFFIANAEILGSILPIPKSNLKLAVYKLIHQLCYGDISEDTLLREIQRQDLNLSIDLFEQDQICFITKALEELTRQAFGTSICYASYLTSKNVNDEDTMEMKRYYKLLEMVKKELPQKYFKDIVFIDSEQSAKVLKKIPIFELYQNYLEGQYLSIDGNYYLIDKIDDNNGIVELLHSSNHANICYRQCRYLDHLVHKNIVKEMPIYNIRDSILKKTIICCDMHITTDGYYEFQDHISFATGEFSYQKVSQNSKGLSRSYQSSNILVINILSPMIQAMSDKEKFQLSFTLSVLLNELFATLFSNIQQYLFVRNGIADEEILKEYADEKLVHLYRPIIDHNIHDGIYLYITEDTELEKGITDAVINHFDNTILKLLYDYLYWLLQEENLPVSLSKYTNDNKDHMQFVINDKFAFLKYGKDQLCPCLDLENAYQCLHDLVLKGNDNLTTSRIDYLKRRQAIHPKPSSKKNEKLRSRQKSKKEKI